MTPFSKGGDIPNRAPLHECGENDKILHVNTIIVMEKIKDRHGKGHLATKNRRNRRCLPSPVYFCISVANISH